MLDLLSETGKSGVKPCSTPMTPNVQITKEGDLFEDLERYRKLVGKLNSLTLTHPYIAYSKSVLSQYMSSTTVGHWAAIEHILCYLKEAPGRGISYKHGISGYCVLFGGNMISWKSKKQSVVSRSSAKSQYRAMAQCLTPNFCLACVMPRNSLSQPSQCPTSHKTQDLRGSPQLVFYYLFKIQDTPAKAPTVKMLNALNGSKSQ